MKIPAIVVDDEINAQQLLQAMLQQAHPEIELKALCGDIPSTVKAIKKHRPRLVFLDIELPGYSGLELLDFFHAEEIDFEIIFTTAYNHYAVDAFKLSAVDYILKPIDQDELSAAIERFKGRLQNHQKYRVLAQNLSSDPASSLAVSTVQSMLFLKLQDILFLKGDGAYTRIFTQDGQEILSSKNLKYYQDSLQNIAYFMRCHKSYIVNLRQVKEYVKSSGGYILIEPNHQILLSSDKKEEFTQRIQGWSV